MAKRTKLIYDNWYGYREIPCGTRMGYSLGYIDEDGNPIERMPYEYPYSYDGYVEWRGGENKEVTGTVYSDRLFQWDYEKYNRCMNQVFGNEKQMFDPHDHEKIEQMLRLYMEEPDLKLILQMKYCNKSSGYPLWRFDYSTGKSKKKKS